MHRQTARITVSGAALLSRMLLTPFLRHSNGHHASSNQRITINSRQRLNHNTIQRAREKYLLFASSHASPDAHQHRSHCKIPMLPTQKCASHKISCNRFLPIEKLLHSLLYVLKLLAINCICWKLTNVSRRVLTLTTLTLSKKNLHA